MKLLAVVGEAQDEARAAVDELSRTHEVTVLATRAFDAPEGVAVRHVERASAALEDLHAQARSYDAVLFFGAADEICASGVRIAPERAIVIPATGDLSTVDTPEAVAVFHIPRALGFRDADEEAAVRARFRNGRVPGELLRDEGALDRLLSMAVR